MKIPGKVKIGGHTLNVELSEDIGNMGEWRSGKQVIKIYKDTCHSQREETLLHEIIECVNFTYELKLSHQKIQILGAVLHQIIIDNPLIFDIEKI